MTESQFTVTDQPHPQLKLSHASVAQSIEKQSLIAKYKR